MFATGFCDALASALRSCSDLAGAGSWAWAAGGSKREATIAMRNSVRIEGPFRAVGAASLLGCVELEAGESRGVYPIAGACPGFGGIVGAGYGPASRALG